MEMLIVAIVAVALGVGLAALWMRGRKGHDVAQPKAEVPHPVVATPPHPIPDVMPTQIVVSDGVRDLMSMTVLDSTGAVSERKREAKKLPQQAIPEALRSLIEPLTQVAPSMATAAAANSSQIMEVVINGQMLAASDGNGLRAIAKAGNGFEHARLYEPSNLQNVANLAAIWQIASVAVAQKHLADISASLKRVESKIDEIQSHMESERRAVITSAMNYLDSARKAVEGGEFLERTRNRLEEFDIELERVASTLTEQIQRVSKRELEHDSVGCEGEYRSALAKHQELSRLAGELTLCNEIRLANWYLCSVYPDNSKTLEPRLEIISRSMGDVAKLKDQLIRSEEVDCAKIEATFTSDKVIHERRAEVRAHAQDSQQSLIEGIEHTEAIVLKIEAVRSDRQATSHLIVETKDRVPSAVYLCSEQFA